MSSPPRLASTPSQDILNMCNEALDDRNALRLQVEHLTIHAVARDRVSQHELKVRDAAIARLQREIRAKDNKIARLEERLEANKLTVTKMEERFRTAADARDARAAETELLVAEIEQIEADRVAKRNGVSKSN